MAIKLDYGKDANAASEVTASANLTNDRAVRGDGGAKGIQTSLVEITDAGKVNLPAGQEYQINGSRISGSDVGLSNVVNKTQVAADGTVQLSADWNTSGHTIFSDLALRAQTLTDGANIDWDWDSGSGAVITFGGDRTMNAPSNLDNFRLGFLMMIAGGSDRTITWNAAYLFPGGEAPTTLISGTTSIIQFIAYGSDVYGVTSWSYS